MKYAFNSCTKIFIDLESDIITNIANDTGFSLKFINKLIYQTQFRMNSYINFEYNEVKLHKFHSFPKFVLY